jgi:Cobalamin biosynthesis protein CobN and related Mg-chelatases
MPAAGFWPRQPGADRRPRATVIFYRALVAGADTAPIAALCEALDAKGLNPVAVYVTSLKDDRSAAFLRAALAAHPPDIIVNATAFATATAHDEAGVLAAYDCPILQVALAGSSRVNWQNSVRGLTPRDLAMHVVLPEVDGRIFAQCHRLQGARREFWRIFADHVPARGRSHRCDGQSRAGLGAIAPG